MKNLVKVSTVILALSVSLSVWAGEIELRTKKAVAPDFDTLLVRTHETPDIVKIKVPTWKSESVCVEREYKESDGSSHVAVCTRHEVRHTRTHTLVKIKFRNPRHIDGNELYRLTSLATPGVPGSSPKIHLFAQGTHECVASMNRKRKMVFTVWDCSHGPANVQTEASTTTEGMDIIQQPGEQAGQQPGER